MGADLGEFVIPKQLPDQRCNIKIINTFRESKKGIPTVPNLGILTF